MGYRPYFDPAGMPKTVFELTAPKMPATQPLDGEQRVDVAVIGGGFTGSSAALHLAEAGASVALLEAKEIGWGASGRNYGQVVPYLRHEGDHALGHFGPEKGERLVRAAEKAPDLVYGLIDRHGIDCVAVRTGLIFAAHTSAAVQRLEKRIAFWEKRNVKLHLSDERETRALIGGGNYRAALLDPRAGTVNPLAYVRGLAMTAMKFGAKIYSRSPVTKIERAGQDWRVSTDGGSVIAKTIIIGTGAYTNDTAWRGLRRSVMPMRSFIVVSKPVEASRLKGILPQLRSVTDTRRMPSGIRLHADGRIQVSTRGPLFGSETKAPADRQFADNRLKELFPELGKVEWEFGWTGWIDLTVDEYPRLHELAPGVFAGMGYSGRGVALATVLGKDLAQLAGGADRSSVSIEVGRPKAMGIPGINELVVKAIAAWMTTSDLIDDRFRK